MGDIGLTVCKVIHRAALLSTLCPLSPWISFWVYSGPRRLRRPKGGIGLIGDVDVGSIFRWLAVNKFSQGEILPPRGR
ncbi:hypothetical protein DFAR_3990028 [Desulfarculales bacterium]